MAAQQFCLRWNNHQPNFISVFSNLLNNESLVDVTLAAEGKHLQAHKVVLSACSSYFQSLFTANPCQHPIVILKDIKYADLKTIIDFMYCGEVNVSQDHLPVILKTAETLKIKGLAEMPDQNMLCVTAAESGVGVGAAKGGGEAHSPSMLRRKRLRKSSTESGSTEQLPVVLPAAGACSNEEVLGSAVASSSPVMVKAEVFSESESSLRHEPSTESEPGLASQDSVEEMSEAACSQQSTDQRSHSQGSGHHPRPQNQSSTSSDDKSDAMLGRSSSTEDTSSPSTSSQPHFSSTGSGWVQGASQSHQYHHQHHVTSQPQQQTQPRDQRSPLSPPLPPQPPRTSSTGRPPGAPRGRRNNPQQSENFLEALDAVRSGRLGFCKAARTYGVNNRTLWLEYKRLGYPLARQGPKCSSGPTSGGSLNLQTSSSPNVTSSGDHVSPSVSPSDRYTPNSATVATSSPHHHHHHHSPSPHQHHHSPSPHHHPHHTPLLPTSYFDSGYPSPFLQPLSDPSSSPFPPTSTPGLPEMSPVNRAHRVNLAPAHHQPLQPLPPPPLVAAHKFASTTSSSTASSTPSASFEYFDSQ